MAIYEHISKGPKSVHVERGLPPSRPSHRSQKPQLAMEYEDGSVTSNGVLLFSCRSQPRDILYRIHKDTRFHQHREATARGERPPLAATKLEVLAEEVEDGFVASGILLFDARVFEVGAGGHPAVDLVLKGLDVLGDGQVLFELGDVLGGLVARGEHEEGHLDSLGVVGIDHGGVDLGGGLEGVVVPRSDQRDDLATPAELQEERENVSAPSDS